MKHSKELKIGIFAVAVLIVSFFMINYLRGKDIFNKEIEVSARYETVDGLVASAPVYIKGYKVGKVTEVTYDTDTEDFIVICSIRREFRIPTDSRMTIYGVDIMGGKGIRIDLGDSADNVSDGDSLESHSEPAMLDGLASGLSPIMDKAAVALDSLESTLSSVNSILSSENSAAVSRTLAHLEAAMADLSSIASGVEGKSGELDAFINNLADMSSTLTSVVEKADSTMVSVSSIIADLDKSEVDKLVISFKELVNNINDPDGTLGRLLQDDSVYDSVDSLINNIDRLVEKIQENPKKYLKISVF